MNQTKSLTAVDWAKLFFAVSILSLHVPNKGPVLFLFAQLVGRIGVPFFFTVSGYFLYNGIIKNGWQYTKQYLLRVLQLLAVWLLIYLPVLVFTTLRHEGVLSFVKEILFVTPAYLWYLTALSVAVLLFFVFYRYQPRLFFCIAAVLFLIGCTGNTYIHILHMEDIWQPYIDLFLSTRNGFFFAPLFLGIGAFIREGRFSLSKRKLLAGLLLTSALFIGEVLWVLDHDATNRDYSFYVMLPFISFFLISFLLQLKMKPSSTQNVRQFSTFVYCSQYGFMVVLDILSGHVTILQNGLVVWISVMILSLGTFCVLKSTRIGQKVVRVLT